MQKQTDLHSLDRLSPFSFVCGKCSSCCVNKKIQINPYEIARMAAHLNITTTRFIQNKTEKGVYLKRRKNGACLFLGKNGCMVHPNRPLVCRLYPLCRFISSERNEYFTVMELMPDCHGFINKAGTVKTYLVSQDLEPYIKAADLYLGLFVKLATALDNEASRKQSKSMPDWVYVSQGDGPKFPFPKLLDIDQVIDKGNGHRIPVSGEPYKKTIFHIKAIEKWLNKLEEDNHEKRKKG